MPKFDPPTGYKSAAPKYVAPDNAMAANMAAQRNVMPANTNPPPIMKKGPFKMNYKKSSFPFKSSPAKSPGHGGAETHAHADDTYLTNTETTNTGPVTSPKLSTIDARLNKLKNTDTTGWSKSELQKRSNELKQGQSARKKELNANIAKRS